MAYKLSSVKKTIIIAEDEKNLCNTLVFLLKKNGYDVVAFNDGFSAYLKIKEMVENHKSPDLVITDLQIPGLGGMELIDYIGTLAFHLPILVITGYGNKETVVSLLRKGCMDYIDKPFDDKTFLAHVEKIFKKEEKRNLELVDIKIKLLKELEQYKKENDDLKIWINTVIDSYRNLISLNGIPESLPLEYRAMPFYSLGGDFFDIRKIKTGYDILFADVAGHDLHAYIDIMLVKNLFYKHRETDGKGDAYFAMLNSQLSMNVRDGRLFTAVFVTINLDDHFADFIVAGHPFPFIITYDAVVQLQTGNLVPGFSKDVTYIKEQIQLTPGMRIILYTDGIINCIQYNSDNGRKFGKSGILESIRMHKGKPLHDMIEQIWADTLLFCGKKPCDDMLLLGIGIPEG